MKEAEAATVYCVIPVHNRKEITRQCLEYLFAQDYPALHVVIVDDGSTDGTGEYLEKQSRPNLTVLKGDGNLWWGGAMRMGMEFVSSVAKDRDYLLMLNDDVRIDREFVSTLVSESIANGGAVVGAAQRNETTNEVIGCGYHIDFLRMCIMPLGCTAEMSVDALPGRGVLFPYAAVRRAGTVNAKYFPHYLADLEYSSRVREMGWRLIVSRNAPVFTAHESSDKEVRNHGWLTRRFSMRSKDNLIQRLLFFSLRGQWALRCVAVPRYLLMGGLRYFRGHLH